MKLRNLGWLTAAAAAAAIASGSTVNAQVRTANPANAWVYSPNVTVNDLWSGVRDGRIKVISTAAANDAKGGLSLVTVFQGDGEVWRCVEHTDSGMVERSFACARVR